MREEEKESRLFAKKLRQEMSRAEVLLWTMLRGKALKGARFRRQHPIGAYVADFACVAQKLVVEVDGATHWTEAQLAHDARRTRYLEGRGWRVLRVTNADIYENLEGVWDMIARHLPPPHPLLTRGDGPPPRAGEE